MAALWAALQGIFTARRLLIGIAALGVAYVAYQQISAYHYQQGQESAVKGILTEQQERFQEDWDRRFSQIEEREGALAGREAAANAEREAIKEQARLLASLQGQIASAAENAIEQANARRQENVAVINQGGPDELLALIRTQLERLRAAEPEYERRLGESGKRLRKD